MRGASLVVLTGQSAGSGKRVSRARAWRWLKVDSSLCHVAQAMRDGLHEKFFLGAAMIRDKRGASLLVTPHYALPQTKQALSS